MDVLKRIHRWLRTDGLVLDLQPEPEPPRVEVVEVGDSRVLLGHIDTSVVVGNIHRARAAVTSLVEAGYFEQECSVVFDFVSHFRGVDEWLRHRQARRSTSVVDPAIIHRARDMLSASPSGELDVSERVLATRLKRRGTLPEPSAISTRV